jgi:hypothetical protein
VDVVTIRSANPVVGYWGLSEVVLVFSGGDLSGDLVWNG